MKAISILLACGVGILLAMFAVGIYVVPKLQAGNSSTPRQSDASRVSLSDVYVDVTYATPEFVERVKLEPYLERWRNRAQPFLIGINTHVGTIADLDLTGKVQLEDSRGERFPSLGSPVVLSEHHNMYLLVFPLVDNYGKPIFSPTREHFRLIVRGVGQTPERIFEWKLPVVEPRPARTLAHLLMLALGVIGSLMVILSPCAIELTSYYTGIIAGIVSSAGAAGAAAPKTALSAVVRGRIMGNLAAFVAGFTLLYMASGATVSLLGNQLLAVQASLQTKAETEDAFCSVTNQVSAPTSQEESHSGHEGHAAVLGGWTRYANWLGAAFLVYFALRAAGVIKNGGACFVWLAQAGRKMRLGIAYMVGLVSQRHAGIIRAPAVAMKIRTNITPGNSFCAGLGLSVSCLTCMGGAILYPLLIFVGTSTWYWGALILGTYSLALAVPMAAIAVSVGHYAWQRNSRPGLIRGLQWTSAVVMITVALLIAFDKTRFINSVVFTVLSAFGGSSGPS